MNPNLELGRVRRSPPHPAVDARWDRRLTLLKRRELRRWLAIKEHSQMLQNMGYWAPIPRRGRRAQEHRA